MSDPPPSSRFRASPAARATWGDVCSPARRISNLDERGLYETCSYLVRLGSFAAPSANPVSSGDFEGAMGMYGNQLNFLGNDGTWVG